MVKLKRSSNSFKKVTGIIFLVITLIVGLFFLKQKQFFSSSADGGSLSTCRRISDKSTCERLKGDLGNLCVWQNNQCTVKREPNLPNCNTISGGRGDCNENSSIDKKVGGSLLCKAWSRAYWCCPAGQKIVDNVCVKSK